MGLKFSAIPILSHKRYFIISSSLIDSFSLKSVSYEFNGQLGCMHAALAFTVRPD